MLDLKNITKRQAIEEHRKMWNWIADETKKQKKCIDKIDYIMHAQLDRLKDYQLLQTREHCFCCVYNRNEYNKKSNPEKFDCTNCPIDWNSKTKSYMCEHTDIDNWDGLYSKWSEAWDNNDYRAASEIARKIANLPEKGDMKPFGDECEINVPDEPIDCSGLNYFDELEYDCWDLIQNYANKFGIKIEGEISFDLAKEIQDVIINQFKNTGVKFKF